MGVVGDLVCVKVMVVANTEEGDDMGELLAGSSRNTDVVLEELLGPAMEFSIVWEDEDEILTRCCRAVLERQSAKCGVWVFPNRDIIVV